jgi:hypothetical protein
MVSADYIVGLTDGEGCFYVNVRDRNSKWTPLIETHFYIKLREDDKELLEEVKESFGCGAVYFQKENRPNHSHCYRFEINSRRDILGVLIPFFEAHPLHGTKRHDFEIFREIALAIKREEHKSIDGYTKIKTMKLQMQSRRARWMREIRPSSGNAKQLPSYRNPPVKS